MTSRETSVSVIIPTYNRADYLRTALSSAVGQELDPTVSYEVVVVDNASTDHTKAVVEQLAESTSVPVRYVHEGRAGVAAARNRGVSEAEGTWLAFMDDDERAQPDWLSQLLAVAADHDTDFVGGAVHLDATEAELAPFGPRSRRQLRERTAERLGSVPRAMLSGELPGTDNMLIARSAAVALEGFDEGLLTGGSDHDFAMRALGAGHTPWVAPDAVVFHAVPAERRSLRFFRQDAMRGGSLQAYQALRYGSTARLLFDLGVRLAHAAVVVVPALTWSRLRADSAAVLDNRLRLWRAQGFALRAGTLLLPALFKEERLLERLNFRKSRVLAGASPERSG